MTQTLVPRPLDARAVANINLQFLVLQRHSKWWWRTDTSCGPWDNTAEGREEALVTAEQSAREITRIVLLTDSGVEIIRR